MTIRKNLRIAGEEMDDPGQT
ncbi:methionine aminopeptidase [Stappia aggregata IAM 12614]|uniref:Methionine aminopeptidase n=1 Tax=Roseibium aggregatum (strain ATCC 25650 / DSM 13394 / JCM 20685 / NBRC 16684 / NCIMB 2208 / IAM 12614 / B1) TaxID=384765 RepID=A0P2W3_ROSAI|nr:methionine aminopeptidase [Stappia aggregata IAM 12614] [Roseibium aggregatum IAM 12614]